MVLTTEGGVGMRVSEALGRWGEQVAVDHLRAAGLEVLARNWRCSSGEIDVVAREGSTLVFCEVKTRTRLDFGGPEEAVGPVKARRLRHLAGCWLAECRGGGSGAGWATLRFDVVAVERPRRGPVLVRHLREAF